MSRELDFDLLKQIGNATIPLSLSKREIRRFQNIQYIVISNELGSPASRFLFYQFLGPSNTTGQSILENIEASTFNPKQKKLSPSEKCINTLGKLRTSALIEYSKTHGKELASKLLSYYIGDYRTLLSDDDIESINENIMYDVEPPWALKKLKNIYSAILQIEKGLLTEQDLNFDERIAVINKIIKATTKLKPPITNINDFKGTGFNAIEFNLSFPNAHSYEKPAALPKNIFPQNIKSHGALSLICINQQGFDETELINYIKQCADKKPYIWLFESDKSKINIGEYEKLGVQVIFLSDFAKSSPKNPNKYNLDHIAKMNLENVSEKLFQITHPDIKIV